MYDTSTDQPVYAGTYDAGVLSNPAYGDLPGAYSEPTGYAEPTGYVYSEPGKGAYAEPTYVSASNTGVYMDVSMEPDSSL